MRDLGRGGLGHGDDLGAVDEAARVLAKHGHLRHHLRELAHHQLLVRCWQGKNVMSVPVVRAKGGWETLTDEGLPLAGGARIAGDREVGLETHLTRVRGKDLAEVRAVAGEGDTLEQSL